MDFEPRGRVRRGGRVFGFYSLAVLLAGTGSLLFADLLWRVGLSPSRIVMLILFSILLLLVCIGSLHAIYGFALRRAGGGRRITTLHNYQNRSLEGTSTALLFPIHNEDVSRVYAGVRAMYESLVRTGEIERFDFFILSGSEEPGPWIEEERGWFELIRDLDAFGRIFYRRQLINESGKSGNIRDFLRAWGRRYRYFIVLDADSIMAGATMVDLVRLMEAHPSAGLIQTAPALVNARSAFARMQQFANRLYGAVFFPGANYWMQDGGNYWGHNAIIRTEPFVKYCDLPRLPGRKPFGGHILSHDFVEAALLRRENWEVWFAWDFEGSYEESPPGIIESAKRDRRWCQGNLQHAMLLFARGLHGISRLHLTLGIFCYLAGPLWLLFMLTGTWMLWEQKQSGLSEITVAAFTPFIRFGAAQHALLVFGIVMFLIMLPKVLGLIELAFDAQRRRNFGGFARATAGVFLETVFSTLHAPILMLFHTKFVIATVFGFGTRWDAQQRAGSGLAWRAAARVFWGHTVIGIAWGVLVWWLDAKALWWFVPVLSGLLLSIPLAVFTSREKSGDARRRPGLFLVPEEIAPPREIEDVGRLAETLSTEKIAGEQETGVREAVLDPYLNAIHVSLLREQQMNPNNEKAFRTLGVASDRVRELGEKLLVRGIVALSAAEQVSVLSDADALSWLHHEAWTRSDDDLADCWRSGIIRHAAGIPAS